ncbi:MAG: hypothetical protein Q4G46_03995, partial [Propionibacteriaceae bacterium]|nr:hypothetical protein [Propionibacteriaceae bacterium]
PGAPDFNVIRTTVAERIAESEKTAAPVEPTQQPAAPVPTQPVAEPSTTASATPSTKRSQKPTPTPIKAPAPRAPSGNPADTEDLGLICRAV